MRRKLALFAVFLSCAAAAAQTDAPVQHYTVKVPTIDGAETDTSPTVCRAPQGKTDSRIPGPSVCRTQRQWDELHARGLDIGADGRSIVVSEKYRSLNPANCGSTAGCN